MPDDYSFRGPEWGPNRLAIDRQELIAQSSPPPEEEVESQGSPTQTEETERR